MEQLRKMPIVTCLLLCIATPAAYAAPNFVVMLLDDHGWGDVGCNNPTVTETPNIDRLAMSGVRFTDFHSGASVCTPVHRGPSFVPGDCTKRVHSKVA